MQLYTGIDTYSDEHFLMRLDKDAGGRLAWGNIRIDELTALLPLASDYYVGYMSVDAETFERFAREIMADSMAIERWQDQADNRLSALLLIGGSLDADEWCAMMDEFCGMCGHLFTEDVHADCM